MSVYKQDIRAYMTYGNSDAESRRVEISSLSVSFGVQELPVAIVQVGVGVDTFDGRLQPDIDVDVDPDVPAKLFIQLQGVRNETNEDWPDEPLLLFVGHITNAAATRLSNQSSGNITIHHILSKLASSSLIASYAFPGSSAELVLPAYRRWKNRSGAKNGSNPPVGALLGILSEDIFSIRDFKLRRQDLWADIAKPFLIRTAIQNQFSTTTKFPSCFPEAGGNNEQALAALATIEGKTDDEYSLEPNDYGTPLLLPEDVPQTIVAAIKSDLTSPKVKDLLQHTAWSYIVQNLCGAYMSAVIPGIDRSRVVPVTPTLNTPYKELSVNSIQVSDRNRPISHSLLAVTMSAGTLSTSGAAPGSIGNPFAFGPCYSPEAASPKGKVRTVGPPVWLRKLRFTAFSAKDSTKYSGGVGMGSYAANPDIKTDEDFEDNTDSDKDSAENRENIRNHINDYGQRYVKAVYGADVTGTRTVKLVSHLRMDIGPGSQLKVITDKDMPIFGNVIYGMVARVTIIIDVNKPFAGTSILLSHIRSEQENALEYIGTATHPLFQTAYKGGPLSTVFE